MTGIPRRPSLVGQDAELAALDQQAALVRTGAFRVGLVTGEPGIGKSRRVRLSLVPAPVSWPEREHCDRPKASVTVS